MAPMMEDELTSPPTTVPVISASDMMYYFLDNDYFRLTWTLQRVSALLSILGSAYILHSILRSSQKRRRFCNHIMVSLSLCDLISSFLNSFLVQWPAPKGQAPGAMGNNATCTITAFFGNGAFILSTYYSASLAICFVLMVRYHWNEQRLKQMRPLLLFVPILLVLPVILTGLALGGGNFHAYFCDIGAPFPFWCAYEGDGSNCERGAALVDKLYIPYPRSHLLNLVQVFVSLPTVLICMILMYCHVRRREQANDRYRFDGQMSRTQSKMVAMQGILYVIAFLLVEIPFLVAICMDAAGIPFDSPGRQLYHIFTSTIIPLQGLFNALVYLRPRYVEYLRKHPENTLANRVRKLFGFPLRLPPARVGYFRSTTVKGDNTNANSFHADGSSLPEGENIYDDEAQDNDGDGEMVVASDQEPTPSNDTYNSDMRVKEEDDFNFESTRTVYC